MKLTDYKSYVVFTNNGEPTFYKFPEEFHLFYEAAKHAFGGVRLLNHGTVVAAESVDHIKWYEEHNMRERFAQVMNGTLSPYSL